MFADNFLRVIDFAALLGIFPVLMGSSKCAPISNEDMGKAVATLLMEDPAKHAGKSYRPTGTDLLSGKDMARIVAKVVGHGVIPVQLPLWMFRKVARQQNIDPYQIYVLLQYIVDNKQGTFSYEGGVTQVMQELTGKPAESFEVTARRYAAMPFARQTFGNRLKAFINFMITPFHPAYDIAAYERVLQLPMPSNPLYCMEDDRWKKSHTEQMAIQKLGSNLASSQESLNSRTTFKTI